MTGAGHDADWQAEVARRWAARLSTTSHLSQSREDVEQTLRALLADMVRALDDPDLVRDTGRAVGKRLVDIRATGEESLGHSLDLLGDALLSPEHGHAGRLLSLTVAICDGYRAADRESIFAQQETLREALLEVKLRAGRELAASEAKFSEVFSTTPIGVAICTLDGKFVQVNPAWEEQLGYRPQQLAPLTIHDVFHPAQAEYLTAVYAELAESGTAQRLEDCRLQRADGRESWAHLAVSVLRDSDRVPCNIVTMVQDVTELRHLHDQLLFQSLHDQLTGLPNRQSFHNQLDRMLVDKSCLPRLTLYHLGLDGFELINDGLGYEAGDSLIKTVAARLKDLVSGEQTKLVARVGGTEFAILICETDETPPVAVMIDRINELLAEPVYDSKGRGIAASASIGVVQRAMNDAESPDVLWAADVALRRAQAAGKRQWAPFDRDREPEERIDAKLAAIMPGGLEQGEFEVVYRPQVFIDTRDLACLEAEIRWDSEEYNGTLEHAACQRLAERSGVTLLLRDWMFSTAWQQLCEWHTEGHKVELTVSLSPNQGQDPDLVAMLRRVLAEGDVGPEWLRLSVPFAAVAGDSEETRDNIRSLSHRGVRIALHGFRGSPEEIRLLHELPVESLRVAEELVDLVRDAESPEAPAVRAIRALLPLAASNQRRLWVGGVADQTEALTWRKMGCHVVSGPGFGDPLFDFDVPRFLTSPQQ